MARGHRDRIQHVTNDRYVSMLEKTYNEHIYMVNKSEEVTYV